MNELISVVLPVYNGEKYLAEAIDSILQQTYTNFELLVIIDGSKDGSLAVAQSYNDTRIKIFDLPQNLGLVGALNKGLELAQGEYIARMDQDDISLPDRFQYQIDFLKKNPSIGILGTTAETFGRQIHVQRMPATNTEIKLELVFKSPICHPTAMFRASVVKQFSLRYDPNFKDTEDWALWHNSASMGVQMANLPQVLLKYRISGQSTTIREEALRKEQFKKVYRITLADIFSDVSEELIENHWAFNSLDISLVNKQKFINYIDSLKNRIVELKFPTDIVAQALNDRIQRIFFKLADHSLFIGIKFMIRNRLYSKVNLKYLLVRCLPWKKKRLNENPLR